MNAFIPYTATGKFLSLHNYSRRILSHSIWINSWNCKQNPINQCVPNVTFQRIVIIWTYPSSMAVVQTRICGQMSTSRPDSHKQHGTSATHLYNIHTPCLSTTKIHKQTNWLNHTKIVIIKLCIFLQTIKLYQYYIWILGAKNVFESFILSVTFYHLLRTFAKAFTFIHCARLPTRLSAPKRLSAKI